MSTPQQIEKALYDLRMDYLNQLPNTIEQVETDWQSLAKAWQKDVLQHLQTLIHKLAGSAGSFGLSALSEAAIPLDTNLRMLRQKNENPNQDEWATIEQQLRFFIQVAKDGCHQQKTEKMATPDNVITDDEPITPNGRLLYLVDDDENYAKDLALHLTKAGYTVKVLHEAENLAKLVTQQPPAALIMDVMLAENDLAGPQITYKIQKDRTTPLPVVFISARRDMTARLAAVRANGDGYFTKPFPPAVLINKLNQLTSPQAQHRYRILIVDDSGVYADKYAKLLQNAGMSVRILAQPMRFLDALEKFPPELILINAQLESISGLEMAMVIRQQDKFARLPLVFFAQQFEQTLRRAAIRGLGDDFISHDVSGEEMIATIINRLKHAEKSHQPAPDDQQDHNRDRLTGLYHRNYLLAQLELLSKQSNRHPLSCVYLNLDNYRGIDKIMGPVATDRILQETAHLLRKYIHPPHVLARFSESVFVVIYINHPLNDIKTIAENIRHALENKITEVGDQHLISTCSIGISVHKNHNDINQMLKNADKACHEAHNNGGNSVVLHDSAHNTHLDQQRQIYWQSHIRYALDNEGFYFAFQPITNLHGEAALLYDVLLRMKGKTAKESIRPNEFLPFAEQSRLILAIDRWVISHVIEHLQKRHQMGEECAFFVRLSEQSLNDEGLLRWISKQLITFNIPTTALIFDIPLDVANENLRAVQNFTQHIKSLGCRFALRDLTNNPGALQLIRLLPVDFIKIQGSLVQSLSNNQSDLEAINTIVSHAHSLNKWVIAPCVEDAKSLNTLWHQEVDYIEGYFVELPEEVPMVS